jgi:ABC-type phosphate transport system auxiliary subunit
MSETVVTAKFVADTTSLQTGVRKAASSMQDVQKGVKQVAGSFTMLKGVVGAAFGTAAVLGIANAGTALKDFATEAVAAAQESQLADRRIEAISRSMGLLQTELGGSTQRLTEYADTLMKQTGVDDEVIKAGQAIILTFKDVASSAGEAGGMFDRTTTAALDLAAAGFGSVEGNARSLARALQDPLRGLTMLSRQGVSFTAQEKEKIKALVESNRLFEAQEIIMGAVEKQVGGTAAATATSMTRLSASMGEVKETLGFALLPLFESVAGAIQTHIIPSLQDFANTAKDSLGPQLAEGFQELLPQLLSIGKSILTIAGELRSVFAPALALLGKLLQGVVPAIDLLAKVISGIPGPIMAAAAALLILRTRMGQALIAGAAQARTSLATSFSQMRMSVIGFSNTVKAEMIKTRTQFGALVAGARAAAVGVASAFRTMGVAIKGFMASLGPIGWAMIGLSVAFEVFSSRSADAEARAMQYKDALDQVTGAATKASQEVAIFNLLQKELGGFLGIGTKSFEELATQAGLSLDEVSRAVHGTTAEYDAMVEQIAEAARQGQISSAESRQLSEALLEERQAIEAARIELEDKNKAEQAAAAATAAATSATVAAAIAAGEAAGPTQGLAMSIGGVGEAADEAADEINAMKAEYETWLSVTGQISAVDSAAAALEKIGTASVEFGTNLMGQTPKARSFRGEVVNAFEASAKAAQSLSDDLPTQRAIFTGELVKIVNSLKASGVKPKDIEAFLGAMDGLPASVSDIMRAAAQAIGDTDFKSDVEKAFDKSVKAGAPMTADAMEQLAEGASKSAKEKLGLTLEPELGGIIKSATTALRPTAFNNGELTGKSIGSGAAYGINQSSPIVIAAVERVMAAAKAAADAAVESKSPSRLFAQTGDNMVLGVAMGWLRMSPTLFRAIASIIPKAKGESGKLAKGMAEAFATSFRESGGSVAAAINDIFGSIPTKTPLEAQLGVKGAEKFVKDNKQALAALIELGEAIDRINEKVQYAGEAFTSLGELVARPFGRKSQISEMFGSEADIDSVIDGFLSIRDQVEQAYSVLTDASIVGAKAAARNRAEMQKTIGQLRALTSQAVQLREQYDTVMQELETLEKDYQKSIADTNAFYDAAEKKAEENIKAIEDRWASAIPGLEAALKGANEAFDKENAVLQNLISQRDEFVGQIKSGFRSFVNSLSFESRSASKQIVKETQRLANGITVTLERELEVGGGPAAIRQTLEERLAAVRDFSRNIRTLMQRGLDPALVQDFVSAGVAGAGEAAAALAAGSQEDLSAINAVQAQLLAETEDFGKYASAQWHDIGIAQQQAIVTPLEIARDAAQKALDDANALRDQELAAARKQLETLRSERKSALAAIDAAYNAEKSALQAQATAMQAEMDAVAAQIEQKILTMLNRTAAKSAEAGVKAGAGLLEGFRKEYPKVYDKLNRLMDQLASSLSRTATLTVQAVYDSTVPVRDAGARSGRSRAAFSPSASGVNVGTVSVPVAAPGAAAATTNNTYQITVNAGIGDPREIGRVTVEAIKAYERSNGRVFASA